MSHDHLDALIAAHQEALETQPEASTAHETILGILRALANHQITKRHAMRMLGLQALSADEPTQAALYRQAAADIRQMQREV